MTWKCSTELEVEGSFGIAPGSMAAVTSSARPLPTGASLSTSPCSAASASRGCSSSVTTFSIQTAQSRLLTILTHTDMHKCSLHAKTDEGWTGQERLDFTTFKEILLCRQLGCLSMGPEL